MKIKRYYFFVGLFFLLAVVPELFIHPVQATKVIKIIKPQYTNGFVIEYLDGGIKRIRDNNRRVLWLIPDGKKVPTDVPRERAIAIPLKRGLYPSVNQVCLLRPFADSAVWKSIAGVATPEAQWFIPQIKTGLANGTITYIGDALSPDYERIQLIHPDIAFVYSGASGLTDLIRKLDELHIPYAVENSYLETHPLGRVEWIKFYAAFYNMEDMASRYYEQAVQHIRQLKNRIPSSNHVRVAWGVIYSGKAYIPGSRSFVAEMIELAGGENVFKNLSSARGSIAVNLEDFFAYSKTADIMIYASFPEYAPNIKSIIQTAPVVSKIKPVQSGNVWALQPWYNQQQDRTDQVLYDLAALFYPTKFKDYRIANFKKLD